MEALLGGLNPDQLRAVTHGTGPMLVVAGAGTGKTQVITRRIAWLIASRRAKPVGDPRTDLHGQGGGRDGGPGGPARPVRLHGHLHRDLPRLRRPAHPRVRARARAAAGRPRPVAGGGRDLPARASLRVRSAGVPAARRPDPVPGRPRDTLQPLQGRGHHPGRPIRPMRTGSPREALALAADERARRLGG